jgi:hypothetical protein
VSKATVLWLRALTFVTTVKQARKITQGHKVTRELVVYKGYSVKVELINQTRERLARQARHKPYASPV